MQRPLCFCSFTLFLKLTRDGVPRKSSTGQARHAAPAQQAAPSGAPVPVVDVLQQLRKVQLVRGVLHLREAPQLLEGVHVPVAHLRATAPGLDRAQQAPTEHRRPWRTEGPCPRPRTPLCSCQPRTTTGYRGYQVSWHMDWISCLAHTAWQKQGAPSLLMARVPAQNF